MLSCSDVSDLAWGKLKDAGYVLSPDDGPEKVFAALKAASILPANSCANCRYKERDCHLIADSCDEWKPAEVKVHVVVTVAGGLMADLWVFTDPELAAKKQKEQDKVYGVRRRKGKIVSSHHDDLVISYVVTVDKFDDPATLRSPWTGNRIA
jgi:hypothetical protein